MAEYFCSQSWLISLNTKRPYFCLESSSELGPINSDLMAAGNEFRFSSKNPEDGNFEKKLEKITFPNVIYNLRSRPLFGCDLQQPFGQRVNCAVSALRAYLWYLQTLAGFYKELRDYQTAGEIFKLAGDIYQAVLFNKDICVRPLSDRTINRLIDQTGDSKNRAQREAIKFAHKKIIERYIDYKGNLGKIRGRIERDKKSHAELYLSYAEFLQGKIMLNEGQIIRNGLGPTLNLLEGSASAAKKYLDLAGNLGRELPSKDDRDEISFFVKRAEEKKSLVVINEILKIAKNIKIKDNWAALGLINSALKKLGAQTAGIPEVKIEALLTKAWALSSRAAISEEKDPESGKADAEASAEIYKRLLAPGADLLQYTAGHFADYKKILQRLAVTRAEIHLNYAENLKLARKYDQAINEYRKIGNIPRPIVSIRQQVGLASALAASANELYFREADRIKTFKLLDEAYAIASKIPIAGGGFPLGQIQAKAEYIKAKDTLAWIESTRGRIKKEYGDPGWRAHFEKAKKHYAEIGQRMDINTQIETGMTLSQLAMRQGDVYKELKEFDKALEAYNSIKDEKDPNYTNGRIASDMVKVEQAKWIYSNSGNIQSALSALAQTESHAKQIKLLTETQRLNHQLLLSQIYGSSAFLKIQALRRNDAKIDLDKAVLELRKLSLKDDKTLKKAHQTRAGLSLSIANLLKLKAERSKEELGEKGEATKEYLNAIRLFTEAGTSEKSQKGIHEANLSLLELSALRARLLLSNGEFSQALWEIKDEKISYLRNLILQLKNKNPLLAFRAVSILCWMLGLKGGILEKTKGEGKGSKYFLQAASVLKKIWEEQNSIFKDENFLILSDNHPVNLLLNQAEFWKAAGAKNLGLLNYARLIFKEIRKNFNNLSNNHPLYFMVSNALEEAQLGEAETKIAMGRLLVENKAEYNKGKQYYEEALKLLNPVMERFFKEGRQIRDLRLAGLGLRSVKAITWALNSLGELKEEQASKQDEESEIKLRPEYILSLIINRALVKGENLEAIKQTLKKTAWAREEGFNFEAFWQGLIIRTAALLNADLLPKIVDFINTNRFAILNEEVFFASQSNEWELKFGYIGNLIAAKLYGEAISEAEATIKEITARLSQGKMGIKEFEFLIDVYSDLGDVYSYKLRESKAAFNTYQFALQAIVYYLHRFAYGTSRQAFNNHLEINEYFNEIEKYLKSKPDLPVKINIAIQRIRAGLAKVYIEKGKYEKGAEFYQKIIDSLSSEAVRRLNIKEIRILASAYLGLGDIYAYFIRDAEKAHDNYNKVRILLLPLVPKIKLLNRYLAQSYLGDGDAYRLREKKFPEAVDACLKGIDLIERNGLKDRESRKVLAQLKASKASALVCNGETHKAIKSLRAAREIIEEVPSDPDDKDHEEIKKRVKRGWGEIWDKNNKQKGRVEFFYNFNFVSSLWQSKSGEQISSEGGGEHTLKIAYNLSQELKATLEYKEGISRRLSPFLHEPTGKKLERLESDPSHSIKVGLDWEKEGDQWNFRFNPYLSAFYDKYRIIKHKFSRDYKKVDEDAGWPKPLDENLFNLVIGGNAGIDRKFYLTPETILLAGVDASVSGLIKTGPSPMAEVERTSIAETEEATGQDLSVLKKLAERLEDGSLVSWSIRPNLRLNLPSLHLGEGIISSSISAGGNFGQDPISVTARFWSLRRYEQINGQKTLLESSTNRLAATFGAQSALNIGKESNYQIPFSFYGEYGTHTYLQGSAGFRYNHEKVSVDVSVGGSYFNDHANSSSSSAFTCGVGVRF